jgi:hypothetical protein
MDDLAFVAKIKEFEWTQTRSRVYPPVPDATLEAAERELGFRIPTLLRLCYLQVSNGGFGPGGHIIGLKDGHLSSYGNLVEIYSAYQVFKQSEGKTWPTGLLPFCEWGCNGFECVDTTDDLNLIWSLDHGRAWRETYSLHEFFEYWMDGKKPPVSDLEMVEHQIINPFTRQPAIVRAHQRTRPPDA